MNLVEQLRKPVAVKFDDHDAIEAAVSELYQRGHCAANRIEELERQLAASQAREAQLRDALAYYANGSHGRLNTAAKALTLPQDTTALEAMIQKAGEVMRERCMRVPDLLLDYQIDAISALPGVMIEDLK